MSGVVLAVVSAEPAPSNNTTLWPRGIKVMRNRSRVNETHIWRWSPPMSAQSGMDYTDPAWDLSIRTAS